VREGGARERDSRGRGAGWECEAGSVWISSRSWRAGNATTGEAAETVSLQKHARQGSSSTSQNGFIPDAFRVSTGPRVMTTKPESLGPSSSRSSRPLM
jgi:hypothetical protein